MRFERCIDYKKSFSLIYSSTTKVRANHLTNPYFCKFPLNSTSSLRSNNNIYIFVQGSEKANSTSATVTQVT